MAVDIAKVYIEAEDRTNAAWTSASRGAEGFLNKITLARRELVALGGTVAGAAGLTAIVVSSVKANAALDDLAESTGLTVEQLSRIKPVAEIAGKSIDDVADAWIKFNRQVQAARNDPNGQQADVFKKLGLDVSKGREADDILRNTIERMDEYREGIGKSAVMSDLFGKTGSKLIPVFKDLAEAGTGVARVSRELAAESETVEKRITGWSVAFRESRNAMGNEFIPMVSAVTQALDQMFNAGKNARGEVSLFLGIPIKDWAAAAAVGFGALVDVVRVTAAGLNLIVAIAATVGRGLYSMSQYAVAAAALIKGDFQTAREQANLAQEGFVDNARVMREAWKEFSETVGGKSFTDQILENLQAAELRMKGFSTEVAKAKKDVPEMGGGASLAQQLQLARAQAELQRSIAEARIKLEQDTTQRLLKDEEYFRQISLTGEEEYIRRKAVLQKQAAEEEVALARLNVAAAREQLRIINAQGEQSMTEKDRTANETQVAAARKQLVQATTELAIKERAVLAVEKERDQQLTLNDVKVRERVIAVVRGSEDFTRSLEQETEEMARQVTLIGQSELAQRKANSEFQLRRQLAEKILQLQREIADLERNGGDPTEVKKRREAIDKAIEDTARAIEQRGSLIEDAWNRTVIANLSTAFADALVDGGKDAGPRLLKSLEDELSKKPLKVKISAVFNKFANGQLDFNNLSDEDMQGLAGIGGSLFGSIASRAGGAGQRGQQNAASWAGSGAMIGTQIMPGWGTVIGAVVGAIAGWASDPDGPAERTAMFGTSPGGNYSFSGRSAFGQFGTFDDRWFSNDQMGSQMRQFLDALGEAENRFAELLTPAQLAAVRSMLATPREYSFGTEGEDFGATLTQITRDRLSSMVETVMPGLGHLLAEADATAEELVNMAQALFGLRDAGKSIGEMIAQISGTPTEQLIASLDAMNTRVSRASDAFDQALDEKDPTKLYAAEQTLTAAILDRYKSEIAMVRQIEQAIRQLDEEAYQFAINIATRINSVGGSRDVGGIALDRAGVLRGRIGGSAPISSQIEDLQGYVGAIDTWYNARRSQIERDIAAQQEASRAIAQAQAAAAQARIQQLQRELAVASAFQQVVDRTQEMLDDLRFSSANPLSVSGRLGLAGMDVAAARDAWKNATGQGKVDAANRLLDLIQTRRGLGQEAFQRPSKEWEDLYNELAADINAVQDDAKTVAEQALDIQKQILDVQRQASEAQSAMALSSASSSAALSSLDAEALAYYEYAEKEGARLYQLQREQHQEQLNAITGGMEVELFIASRQAAAVDFLRSIDANIALWLSSNAGPMPTGTTGTNSTGGPSGDTPTPEGGSIVLQVDSQVLAKVIGPIVDKQMASRASSYKRTLMKA